MRAVKCKDGVLSLIGSQDAKLFNKIEFEEFVNINSLSERDAYIAEEMYKKNILRKVRKGDKIGYKVYKESKII